MDSGGPWYGGEQRPWLVPALVGGGVIILIILIVGALAVRGRGGASPTATRRAPTATNQIILAPSGSPAGSPIGGIGLTPSTGAAAGTPAAGSTAPAAGGTKPAASASAAAKVFVVTGTGGEGLNMRDAPGGNVVTTLPDGTRLEQVGPDQKDSSGATWHNVRTPDGTVGWVSAQFTQEAP